MRVFAFALLILTAGFVSAEDKKEPPKGEDVSGKVSLDGKPLVAGTITFLGKDGLAVSTLIGKDGTYAMKVPVGEYAVAIGNPPPKKGDKEPKPIIPAKYGDPKTSGLTYKVAKGKQTFDIELKSK